MWLKKKKHSQPSAERFSCLTIFITGENGSEVRQKQDVKAWDSCDLVPNLNPNWGGGGGGRRGKQGGTRQNHDVSEDLTNGSMKT